MSEVIGKVHGKHHTFEIKKEASVISSSKYYVVRDDGQVYGSYSTRAAAFKAARDKAGPNAYET